MDSEKRSEVEPAAEPADSTGSDLAVEPGRPFSPKGADRSKPEAETVNDLPPVPPVPPEPMLAVFVGEEQVRGFLVAQGAAVHGLVAVEADSSEWVYLESDLEAIAPPLTRIINRFPIVAATFERFGDWPALGMGALGYVGRSLEERSTDKARQLAEVEALPTTDIPFTFGGPEE